MGAKNLELAQLLSDLSDYEMLRSGAGVYNSS
jgi:hypothetical protein